MLQSLHGVVPLGSNTSTATGGSGSGKWRLERVSAEVWVCSVVLLRCNTSAASGVGSTE